ncbi:MAG: hypothetical protein ACKOEH_07945, partial [Actinomycetota bacterium]
TWKVVIPNRLFGRFHPYVEKVDGDWFTSRGRNHHRGCVYLNGAGMSEAPKLDSVLQPAGETPLWFAKVDGVNDDVPESLMNERLAELREMQDAITARRRDELIGLKLNVLVDEPGVARSHREAPEIDGVISVNETLTVGSFVDVEIADAFGPDLVAVGARRPASEMANDAS